MLKISEKNSRMSGDKGQEHATVTEEAFLEDKAWELRAAAGHSRHFACNVS